MKTLKLKYGEYYNLKITDSSKNVINNVEITASQITTNQHVFKRPSFTIPKITDEIKVNL